MEPTPLLRAQGALVDARAELAKAQRREKKWHGRGVVIASHIRRLERDVERLSYPPEPDEGKVVRFQKQYLGRTTVYSFAAVRGGDRWWVTGDSPLTKHGITWQALIGFVRSGNILLPQDPRVMVDEDDANVAPF